MGSPSVTVLLLSPSPLCSWRWEGKSGNDSFSSSASMADAWLLPRTGWT